MNNVTRRDFIKKTSLATASLPFLSVAGIASSASGVNTSEPGTLSGPVKLRWLEGGTPKMQGGTAFGVPWPKGKHAKGTDFMLRTPNGKSIPMQTWTTATWPDGSLKWTGHALPTDTPSMEYYEIVPGKPATHSSPIHVDDGIDKFIIDTGLIQCSLPKKGSILIDSVKRGNKIILSEGLLTGMRQDSPDHGASVETFKSNILSVSLEQSGPIRAVVKIEGKHQTENGRAWLPFSVRLYFHAGSDEIRMTHTFVFDGDEHKDFISGLGVRFSVPMHDELYNRHVRFAGQDNGLWGEAIQGLTGLRRNPGKEVREAQINGKKVPDIRTWPEMLSTRIHWVPTWSDFSLSQLNANGFSIKKRTKPGYGWINSGQGQRSEGLGYIGGASGGVVFGMRDFWKLHPTQLDIRDSATDLTKVTLWMWSPEAPPMDIRFYHDGLGQDIEGPLPNVKIDGIEPSVPDHPHLKQLDALNITYEDYEGDFGSPHGVARSTDITLKIVDTTPSREKLSELATAISTPPQLLPRPEDMLRAQAFGSMWDLPNRSSKNLAAIEDQLDWTIQYYKTQVEQHHWYGFWDYGDVMHTYDSDRHTWRYDVGGFAWDNSELSTDLWLWFSFIRSGNADAYRLAEAMNRHNRDVDLYHLGRFAGLGTRHNVQHWGCSAKQLRVSTCMNRRFHYYLTTDERTGDVLQEVAESDLKLKALDAHRKIYHMGRNPHFSAAEDSNLCRISSGTDYGAALANWLTAWERTGESKYREWIENSMRSIGNSKFGFFTDSFWFDLETKKMTAPEGVSPQANHLKIMFGLPEVISELIELIDIPEFKEKWINYCILSNASKELKEKELGESFKSPNIQYAHSRITAYAASKMNDKELAKRAAKEFYTFNRRKPVQLETRMITGPDVLNPVDEATWLSTNGAAQWGLAAIQTSALIPEALTEY